MILSAFADEYCDDFCGQLEFLNREGIGLIEIRGVNGKNISTLSESEAKECKKELDKAGIKVSSMGSPLGKYPIEDDINPHLDTAKKIFEFANLFGAKLCRVFSFYMPEGKNPDDYKEKVYENLEKLICLSEQYGVSLCHENEWGIYGQSPEKCLELINRFDGRFHTVFDMGNYVLDGYKPWKENYESLKHSIRYFHIKDALSAGAIVPAGCGEANIKEILSDYQSTANSDFFVSIEPHLQTFSGLNQLAGKNFDNPYKFETKEKAFEEELRLFRALFN